MFSVSSCFLLFLRFRKSLKEISLELDHNLRRIFIERDEDGVQRSTQEATQGPGRPPARILVGPRPLAACGPWCPPSRRLFGYKIPLDLKVEGRPLFSMKPTRSRRHLETLIREGSEALPDILSEGRSSLEASSPPWLPPW